MCEFLTAPSTESEDSPIQPPATSLLLSGVSLGIISEIARENPSFRGYLQGYLAEHFLRIHLNSVPGIGNVVKIPDHQKDKRGDFSFTYQGRSFSVESKSLLSGMIKDNVLDGGVDSWVSIKRTGTLSHSDSDPHDRSCSVPRGDFDILALNTFNVNGKWDFLFMHNKYIPESTKKPGFLKMKFRINTLNTPCLYKDILKTLPTLD